MTSSRVVHAAGETECVIICKEMSTRKCKLAEDTDDDK